MCGWGWGARRPAMDASSRPQHTLCPEQTQTAESGPRRRRGSRPHSGTLREDRTAAPAPWRLSLEKEQHSGLDPLGRASQRLSFRPRNWPQGPSLARPAQHSLRWPCSQGPAATPAFGPGPKLGAPSQAGWTRRPAVLLRGKWATARPSQGGNRTSRLRCPAEDSDAQRVPRGALELKFGHRGGRGLGSRPGTLLERKEAGGQVGGRPQVSADGEAHEGGGARLRPGHSGALGSPPQVAACIQGPPQPWSPEDPTKWGEVRTQMTSARALRPMWSRVKV